MERIVVAVLALLGSAVPSFAAAPIQVPEPASMSLFGLGLGGAYLAKRFLGRK